MGRIPGVAKTNQQNTSPTPTTAAWNLRQQTQAVSEGGYQYSQLSPSRSPTTYTTLSGSGQTARQANYHTASTTQQQGKI